MAKPRSRPVTAYYYANCYIALRYLKFKGRVTSIKKVRNGHFIGKIKGSNRWLHFKALDQNLSRWQAMLLFRGRLEVLERRKPV